MNSAIVDLSLSLSLSFGCLKLINFAKHRNFCFTVVDVVVVVVVLARSTFESCFAWLIFVDIQDLVLLVIWQKFVFFFLRISPEIFTFSYEILSIVYN